jgi:hypothetical protein
MEVTGGQVRAVRRTFKKFPLYFLNSLLGCSGCVGSGIVTPLASSPGRSLRTASRNFNRTSQYDGGFIISPRFRKCANSTP